MADFEQWAEHKADEVKKRKGTKEAVEQALIEDNALKAQQAPELWKEVRMSITDQVDFLNGKLRASGIPGLRPTKRLETRMEVEAFTAENKVFLGVAKYNPDACELGMSIRNNYSFPAEVRSGKVSFCRGARGEQISPVEIAQLFVGELADTL
jgi:hypothetical protein